MTFPGLENKVPGFSWPWEPCVIEFDSNIKYTHHTRICLICKQTAPPQLCDHVATFTKKKGFFFLSFHKKESNTPWPSQLFDFHNKEVQYLVTSFMSLSIYIFILK